MGKGGPGGGGGVRGRINGHLEAFIEASRGVSGKDAHEHKQQQYRRHKTPPIGGGEETQHGEDHGDHRHADELGARPDVGTQQHRLLGWPEHITVHLQDESISFVEVLSNVCPRELPRDFRGIYDPVESD
jgi:hypothetical protein